MFVSGFCPNCGCFFEVDSSVLEDSRGHANCIQCGEHFFAPKNISRGFLSYTNEDIQAKTDKELPIIGTILEQQEEENPLEASLDKILASRTDFAPSIDSKTIFQSTAEFARPDLLHIYDVEKNWTDNFDEPSTFTLVTDKKPETNYTDTDYDLNEEQKYLIPYIPLTEEVEKTEPQQVVEEIDYAITEPQFVAEPQQTEPLLLEKTGEVEPILTQEIIAEPDSIFTPSFFIEKPFKNVFGTPDISYFPNNFYSTKKYEFEPPVIRLQGVKTEPDLSLVEPPEPDSFPTEPQPYIITKTAEQEHISPIIEDEEELVPIYKDFLADDKVVASPQISYTEPIASYYTEETPSYTKTSPEIPIQTITPTEPIVLAMPADTLVQPPISTSKQTTNVEKFEDFMPNFTAERDELLEDLAHTASREEIIDIGSFVEPPQENQIEPQLTTEEDEEIEEEEFIPPPLPYYPPVPQQQPIQQFFYMLPYGSPPPASNGYPTNYPQNYEGYDDEEYIYQPKSSKLRAFGLYIFAGCLFVALGYFLINK